MYRRINTEASLIGWTVKKLYSMKASSVGELDSNSPLHTLEIDSPAGQRFRMAFFPILQDLFSKVGGGSYHDNLFSLV